MYVTNTESPTLVGSRYDQRRVHENPRCEHEKPTPGYTSVRCNKEYAAKMESQNTWCNRMATSEVRLRIRRERDRLRQVETTEEREATFINSLIAL